MKQHEVNFSVPNPIASQWTINFVKNTPSSEVGTGVLLPAKARILQRGAFVCQRQSRGGREGNFYKNKLRQRAASGCADLKRSPSLRDLKTGQHDTDGTWAKGANQLSLGAELCVARKKAGLRKHTHTHKHAHTHSVSVPPLSLRVRRLWRRN